MTLPTRPLTVTINGRRYGPIDVPEGLMMIDVLHEMFGLTGSRLGCGIGICHACVVIWDRDDQTSEEVQTCITGAGFFAANASAPSRASPAGTTRAISSRSLRCSRPSSTSSASNAGTARRASSTPPPC